MQSQLASSSSTRVLCWSVLLLHHCQPKQSLKHESSGESLVTDDSSLRTNARRTQRQAIPRGAGLPPQIQQALVLRAAGASWIDCAAGAGVDVRNLRKWRKHPQAEPFLNEQIRGNLQQAQTLFAEAAPKLAERLIKLGLDERVKGYTAVSAISEAFKILQTGVVDQQQREQIEAIKAQLTALEDGTPNVIDV